MAWMGRNGAREREREVKNVGEKKGRTKGREGRRGGAGAGNGHVYYAHQATPTLRLALHLMVIFMGFIRLVLMHLCSL